MTWSPFFSVVTPGPTSTTMPAPSWPKIAGNKPSGSAPERVNSSVWQMPVALISTSTSPAFGPSSCTVSMASGWPAANATAALTSIPPPPVRDRLRGPGHRLDSAEAREPSAGRFQPLRHTEEAVAEHGLVLVDRTLLERRRVRHAHRHLLQARFERGLAADHAAVELVEVGPVDQRPGVGGAAFVQHERARALRAVFRRAVHQSH